MKILQINAVNKIASTGRNAFELSEYLSLHGHSSVIAYSKGPSVNPDREFKIGGNTDTKIHGLMSRLFGKQGYYSNGATKKLLRYMNDYAPDVVVLNNLHGNYINLPMLLKYLAKKDIATVAVLHDCWFYTGKCCHYTTQGCYKWQDSCGNCPTLKKYNKSWFFDRTKSMLRDKKELFGNIPRLAVVGVSDWITNEAKKAPVFKNAKVFERIYNWIDTDKFVPKETTDLRTKMGLTDKKVILCVASGWSKEKGLDTVLEIAQRLDEGERILLVGNISADVSLSEKIIHVPATNSVDELVSYYSMADVFVQPSLEETFGKVSAEALACGTPVVCFDSTANPELVGEGCGAVVNVGDIDNMLCEIRTLFKRPSCSNNCISFAVLNFEKEKNLLNYLCLFKKIHKFRR